MAGFMPSRGPLSAAPAAQVNDALRARAFAIHSQIVPTLADKRADASLIASDVVVDRPSPSVFSDAFTGSVAAEEQRAPSQRCRIPAAKPTASADFPEAGVATAWHADASGEPLSPRQQPRALPSADLLVQRCKRVFLSSDDGPVASADGGVAVVTTIALVLAVRDAVDTLWKAYSVEIKRRCATSMPQGLIAKQEVFGFALADALGRPILPGERAMKVGQNGDNAVRMAEGAKDRTGQLTDAREAARASVRKAKRAAAKDSALSEAIGKAEKAGEAAIAAVLATEVDLHLPNETVGAKRKHPPARTKAAAPAEVSAEVLPKLAHRRQAVRAAQDAVRAAAEAHGVNESRVARAQRQLVVLGPVPEWSDEFYNGETVDDLDDLDDDQAWREKRDAMEARMEERYAKATAPFERAQERLLAAEQDARESKHALQNAERSVCDAERAVERAVQDVEEMEQWEREQAERAELRAENVKLRAENADLRKRLEEYELLEAARTTAKEEQCESEWEDPDDVEPVDLDAVWDSLAAARAEE